MKRRSFLRLLGIAPVAAATLPSALARVTPVAAGESFRLVESVGAPMWIASGAVFPYGGPAIPFAPDRCEYCKTLILDDETNCPNCGGPR